ncbi:SDR family NAD(P)-dependent oxidoreductase [Methylophaga sulfidovorans]|nr:SDR family NAD(P)-dependent oxidoreductase [Methylophaga sulfidovorans]
MATVSVNSELVIFGTGAMFESCLNQILLVFGRLPVYVIDNDETKWGKHFLGIECRSPEFITTMKNPSVVIMVKRYSHIVEQLLHLGIKPQSIYTLFFDRAYDVISQIKSVDISFSENVAYEKSASTNRLKGKYALITGASRGIGFTIAKTLAFYGVNIIAIARAKQHCEKLIEVCSSYPVDIQPYGVDLMDSQALKVFLEEEVADVEIDILVNSAGVAPKGLSNIWNQQQADYLSAYQVNTIAPVLLSSHIIPNMMKRGFGRVINISSNIRHRPAEMAYACSKAALDKYVFDMAHELQNSGVLMSCFDPGWVRTDMGGEAAPNGLDSIMPGALMPLLLDDYVQGQWFSAEDYVGMTLDDACKYAFKRCRKAGRA